MIDTYQEKAAAVAAAWRDKIATIFGARLDLPRIEIVRAGRRYVSEYRGAKGVATITINSQAISLNPWTRIVLSIGHEMAHHYISENNIDAGIYGHGAKFREIVRGLGIPCHGQYAKVGPAKLPPSRTTRFAYSCRCERGKVVRAVYLNARCLDCGQRYERTDVGQVEASHSHGFTIGEKIRHKHTGHRGEIVGVGSDSIAIRMQGGKVRGYPPSALERVS